ncbi:MAG: YkvA family protein [Chromatiales bacterium]|jgi:uncharacterized membrane protein YkvA (DUF1232 family)|nr:YkvA family protein [Chromatiales bacterium]MDH4014983.1 YkvA family protein [Chromatiales bacterium]PLX57871.1 MAG: hypothetical protein C0629_00110 [Chromatiales bacterium]
MTMRVTFELQPEDLKHFRLIMREARDAAKSLTADEILRAANNLLLEIEDAKVPHFIEERLKRLRTLIGMVEDDEWSLPQEETARVLNALAYFAEPEDLIPDHIPGLGFLDDAIMIELVARELRHEIEAYDDFCAFRDREGARRRSKGQDDDVTRGEWLETRRTELMSRMRRRRRRDRGRKRSGGRSPLSLL